MPVGSEKGSSLVEFAMILPVLLFLLLGMADFGMMLQAQAVVANAAREGARSAILVDEGYTAAAVQAQVAGYIAAGIPRGATPTTAVTACQLTVSGNHAAMMKVSVVYPYSYRFVGGIARLLGRSFTTLNVTGSATMRRESPLSTEDPGLPAC